MHINVRNVFVSNVFFNVSIIHFLLDFCDFLQLGSGRRNVAARACLRCFAAQSFVAGREVRAPQPFHGIMVGHDIFARMLVLDNGTRKLFRRLIAERFRRIVSNP